MRVLIVIGVLTASSCWAQEPAPTAEQPAIRKEQPLPSSQPSPQPSLPEAPQPRLEQQTQQPTSQPPQQSTPQMQTPAPAASEKRTITVPAGTRIALVLTSPIGTASSQVGDPVRAVTDFPVSVDNGLAIPAGTYVEGEIGEVLRPSFSHRAGIEMRFTKLIFASGYTAPISGTTTDARTGTSGTDTALALGRISVSGAAGVSDAGAVGDVRDLRDVAEATAAFNAGVVTKEQAFQLTPVSFAMPAEPQQLPTQPTLPPSPKIGPSRGAVIGIGAAAVGCVVLAVILLSRRHQSQGDIYFQAGWKFDLILQTPLTLDADNVATAVAIANK
jgi:hypothetical protein